MNDIKGAAATVFIAGFDTTNITILVAILALLQHPVGFEKASEILDRVIGAERLPSLQDCENPELRYLDLIVKEISRWRTLSPLGIPHLSLEDDVYNGMLIPGRSTVLFNAWAMSRDEDIYRDPEVFNPERYLSVEEGGQGEPVLQAPSGFGRRVYPGKQLAQASVWIALATLIVAVDIEGKDGENGKVRPEVDFSSGLSSHPDHFDCVFQSSI